MSLPARNLKPKATAWVPKTASGAHSSDRLLIVRSLNLAGDDIMVAGLPVVLLERQGALLYFEVKARRPFEYVAGDTTLTVRQAFLGHWILEENGVETIFKRQGAIPFEEWQTTPIQFTAQVTDSELLKRLTMLKRQSDFDNLVASRGLPSTAASAAHEEVQSAISKSKAGESALIFGGLLLVLGVGYFLLPEFGFQFKIFQTTPPSVAIIVIVAGVLVILSAFRNLRRRA